MKRREFISGSVAAGVVITSGIPVIASPSETIGRASERMDQFKKYNEEAIDGAKNLWDKGKSFLERNANESETETPTDEGNTE